MFTIGTDGNKLGLHLREVIYKNYESVRQFCKAYLELRDGETNDEEIRKLLNRFSQMLKGTKRIQIDDLPYVTELLGISCEEVLSGGTVYIPVCNRVTNYDIAFSHDRAVWDRYMKREDKLFLNCDEYCKSVIDYALDFKNYDFIKYLMDEHYIWLVDQSQWKNFGYSYGAGTSVKRRDIGDIDTHTPLEIQYQDKLRTRTIALAIENEDYEILDSLLAREVPEMHNANMVGYPDVGIEAYRNDEMIRSIAAAGEKIIDYFSQEFAVTNKIGDENLFMYPFLVDVICGMIERGRNDMAELVLRRAIDHNRDTLKKLTELIDEASGVYADRLGFEMPDMEEFTRKQAMDYFRFDQKSSLVSFCYFPQKHKRVGFITNIFRADVKKGNSLIRELLAELNGIYDEIILMKEAK